MTPSPSIVRSCSALADCFLSQPVLVIAPAVIILRAVLLDAKEAEEIVVNPRKMSSKERIEVLQDL